MAWVKMYQDFVKNAVISFSKTYTHIDLSTENDLFWQRMVLQTYLSVQKMAEAKNLLWLNSRSLS